MTAVHPHWTVSEDLFNSAHYVYLYCPHRGKLVCSQVCHTYLGLVQTASPKYIFWHIQIDFRKSGHQKTTWNSIFANRIQATFGGGLKCDSNLISTDASKSGRSGGSNRISKCPLCHSQRDTQQQQQHQIQSDGIAWEWLSRIHAATSRVVWRTIDTEIKPMMDLHFSCFRVGNPRHQRT